ncbi:hypothetical protein Tco_0320073 [Tanacetum coccineum]
MLTDTLNNVGAQRYATKVTVACKCDQWGRAFAGTFDILACGCVPRHLTTEQEVLLSATLIHEFMHVLRFDAHAFTHFTLEKMVAASVEDDGGRGTLGIVSRFMMVEKETEKEVMEYYQGKMLGYMVPKPVVFKEDLSKTSIALGWLLEETHMNWAHFEKKRTRLRLYTKSDEENAYNDWRRRHNYM